MYSTNPNNKQSPGRSSVLASYHHIIITDTKIKAHSFHNQRMVLIYRHPINSNASIAHSGWIYIALIAYSGRQLVAQRTSNSNARSHPDALAFNLLFALLSRWEKTHSIAFILFRLSILYLSSVIGNATIVFGVKPLRIRILPPTSDYEERYIVRLRSGWVFVGQR